MGLQFEGDDLPTPESRAAILAEMLRYVAALSQPGRFGALFEHLLRHFGVREEDIALEIYASFALLARSGLIVTDIYNPATQVVGFTGDPEFRSGRLLIDYIWSIPKPHPDDLDLDDLDLDGD